MTGLGNRILRLECQGLGLEVNVWASWTDL